MNEQNFVDRRMADWKRLRHLCDLAENSVTLLSAEELREFVRLYRRVSTDLSIARTRSTNPSLADYLNDLAGRAYGILYRAPRKGFFAALVWSIALAAQTFRRRFAFILTSAGIFFGAALFAFFVMRLVPDTRDVLVPAQMEETFERWKSGQHEDRGSGGDLAMTGFYASNNPKAAMMTAAVGAGTFGVGSVYLLFTNGALLGALARDTAGVGNLDFLLSSIIPHGVPELSGIIVAGAAGLLFAWALINPGRRTRGDALREVGRDGVVLIVTSVVLMFMAAPIEGFFSFNPVVPGYAKVAFALVEIVAWTAFWVGYGKSESPA